MSLDIHQKMKKDSILVYIMQLFSVVKKIEIMIFVGKCMEIDQCVKHTKSDSGIQIPYVEF